MALPIRRNVFPKPGPSREVGDSDRTDLATSVPANAERKKKWASRSRTGCLTCRKRRVKCDEATPICRRCVVGPHECRWGGPRKDSGFRYRSIRPQTELQKREKRVFFEAEPPDWDYMQAVRFYFQFIRPGRPVENGKIVDPSFSMSDATYFTTLVVGAQLGFLSKSRGKILTYGEGERVMARLWNSYTRYISKMIELINGHIREATAASFNSAIWYMATLVALDLAVESRLWLAHVNGCLAYVQSLGGAQVLVDWSPSTPIRFRRIFRSIVFHNTTIPARQHSLGYYQYTDAQLEVFLNDDDFSSDKPFPTRHKIIVIHLTRLRYQIATADALTPPAALASTVAGLFRRLHDVDLDDWAQKVGGFGVETDRAMAELYRDAIWLYALLSLPRAVMLLWATTQPALPPPDAPSGRMLDAYDRYRHFYRSRLFLQLRELYPMLQYPPAVNWALVVAGVSAVDGEEEDRQFVHECIYTNWQRPVGPASVFLCLQKLREFWPSGETGWEDCFYEPTPT